MDDDLDCHDDFIRLHSPDVSKADASVAVIKDVILPMNLNLKNCQGQCYDGCSTIKEEKTGVTKQIKLEETKALLTHCFTHSLNLAVGDAI